MLPRKPAASLLAAALILSAASASFAQAPGDFFGYRAQPVWGGVPVLTILWQFSDGERFPGDYRSKYTSTVFGGSSFAPLTPSLAGELGFFDQASNGNFNFRNAGVIGPLAATDVVGTAPNESTIAGAGPGMLQRAVLAAEAAGFDFSRFDVNRDGVLTKDELVVSVINSDRRSHEFIATTSGSWAPSAPAGALVYNDLNYTYSQLLGHVYSPDAPRPAGTVSLNLWIGAAAADNYTTTLTDVGALTADGYSLVGRMGYLVQSSSGPPAGTVGIDSYYNPVRRDFRLASGNTSAEVSALSAAGYTFHHREGFIFSPASAPPPGTMPLWSWEGHGLIGGGQTPWLSVTLASGLEFSSKALNIAQDGLGNLSGLAHEMTHYAGGIDTYGAGFGKNYQYSLMGALQGGKRVSHPDPMNKIVAGWVKPIVKTIGSVTTFDILGAENSKNTVGKAVVFYDPARGNKEFFVLEYRHRNQVNTATVEPLYNLWDSPNQDNWASNKRGGFLFDPSPVTHKYVKTEGFVYKASLPQPAGTVPLYSWYSTLYADGFTTTNPVWTGVTGSVIGSYTCKGIIGYVHDPALARPDNTLPLYSWYSESRTDNFMTTDLEWAGTAGATRAPDYRFIRVEGYLPQGSLFNYDAAPFTNLSGIPDEGLAVWYVKIGADGVPLVVTARDGAGNPLPGQADLATYILPPSGAWGFSDRLFKSTDGLFSVTWPDGTPSGLDLQVLTTDLTKPILRVRAQ